MLLDALTHFCPDLFRVLSTTSARQLQSLGVLSLFALSDLLQQRQSFGLFIAFDLDLSQLLSQLRGIGSQPLSFPSLKSESVLEIGHNLVLVVISVGLLAVRGVWSWTLVLVLSHVLPLSGRNVDLQL